LGFAAERAASGHNFPRPGKHIGHLKTKPGPCPPTFPSAVNSDRRTAYNHLTHDIRFSRDLACEDVPVESHRSLQLNSPDAILNALFVHWMIFRSNLLMRVRRSQFTVRGTGIVSRGADGAGALQSIGQHWSMRRPEIRVFSNDTAKVSM